MILILQKQIWTKWNMIKGEKSWKHCLYQVIQMEHTMFENILGVSKKKYPILTKQRNETMKYRDFLSS